MPWLSQPEQPRADRSLSVIIAGMGRWALRQSNLMRIQILQAAMIAALLACAIGIAAFARGAYEYSVRQSAIGMPQGLR